MVFLFLSIQSGVTSVPIHTVFKKEEFQYIINNTKVKMMFVSESQLEKVLEISDKCPTLKYIVVMNPNWKEINKNVLLEKYKSSQNINLLSLNQLMKEELVDLVPMKLNDVQTRKKFKLIYLNFFFFFMFENLI